MKAKRQIISYQDMHIDVEKVTLLSTSEYIAWRDAILPIHECWWLRSRGISQVYAMDVWYDGSLSEHVVEDYNGCVRPALRMFCCVIKLLGGHASEKTGKQTTRMITKHLT